MSFKNQSKKPVIIGSIIVVIAVIIGAISIIVHKKTEQP